METLSKSLVDNVVPVLLIVSWLLLIRMFMRMRSAQKESRRRLPDGEPDYHNVEDEHMEVLWGPRRVPDLVEVPPKKKQDVAVDPMAETQEIPPANVLLQQEQKLAAIEYNLDQDLHPPRIG